MWKTYEIQILMFINKVLLSDSHTCMFTYHLWWLWGRNWQMWVVAKGTVCGLQSKIFTVQSFTDAVCQHQIYNIQQVFEDRCAIHAKLQGKNKSHQKMTGKWSWTHWKASTYDVSSATLISNTPNYLKIISVKAICFLRFPFY